MAPEQIYEQLVASLRVQGVVCAITSGMACVYYGVAESTKGCEFLCHSEAFETLLNALDEFKVAGSSCAYRGNLSPPLAQKWHAGGWTSPFEWAVKPDPLLLDVFGRPVRQFSPWEHDLSGLYAGANTVAAMKRTARDKDWPSVTALGVRMIEAGDDRGWLHLFKADSLQTMLQQDRCPEHIARQQPALRLGLDGDPRLAGALNAERKLWEEIDRRRIRIMEHALRPYVAAVRSARTSRSVPLREDHELRLRCAQEHLPVAPLLDYGLDRLVQESRRSLVDTGLIPETGLDWLPESPNWLGLA